MGEKCVLILEPEYYRKADLERLKAAGYRPVLKECATQKELFAEFKRLRDEGKSVEAIFVKLGLSFDRELFYACGGELKFLVTPTTGLNHIDQDELECLGIKLISLKGETAFLREITPTAELVFALLLALLRMVPQALSHVLAGYWQRRGLVGRELKELTLGVVGLGRLGTMVAGYGRVFGMPVIAYDLKDEPFQRQENIHVERKDTLGELVAEADVVSIHLPWDEDTAGLFDEDLFKQFKQGAYLVNTARGEIIDEAALLKALKEDVLAGCAIDVLHGDSRWAERVPEGHPLVEYAREHDNLIITPHIGGYTVKAIQKTRTFMVDKFLAALGDKGVFDDS